MKYKDPEIQSTLLDLYAMHGTDAKVSRLSGVSRVTLWRMNTMSEAGDADLQEVFWGGIGKPWHEHRLDALDMLIEDVAQDITAHAALGRYVPMVHSGEYNFEPCEYAHSLTAKQFAEALKMDDETCEMLGVPRVWEDKFKRVLNSKTGLFERVRATQFLPPTTEAQSKVLASFAPDVFGDKRKVDVSLTGGLGVSVMSALGAKPTPPMLEMVAVPTVPEIEFNTSEPVPAEPLEQFDPEEEPLPEPVAAPIDPGSLDAEQAAILQRLRSPSPLARDLAQKADENLKRRIAAGDPDVDPRRVGYGPQPTGYKVS